MKKIIFAIFVMAATTSFAQNQLEELTFDDTQNSEVFQRIKNNTRVLRYIAADGTVLQLGDTLILGYPSGSTTSTTGIAVGEKVGVGTARSQSQNNYAMIFYGRQGGMSTVLNSSTPGEGAENVGANMQSELVVVAEMKVFHKGSAKKPLALNIALGEPNGRAFGLYKYLSILDYEKAVLAGEIRSLYAPLTREEAIAKLKEAKDLLDLGLMSESDYEKMKQDLGPIIMNK